MTVWPNISVIIPTYNRPKILEDCVRALMSHLRYPGTISYHIGNDGEADVGGFSSAGQLLPGWGAVYVYDGPRRVNKDEKGLGANLNMLMMSTSDDLLIQLDDDHILMQELDLAPLVAHMMRTPKAAWVRLYGVANHCYQASLEGNYWYVDWNSVGDYSLYIPSNRPHLKTRWFHHYFGWYPVNKTLGETEEGFCHQCRNVMRKLLKKNPLALSDYVVPHVCVPLNPPVHTETGWDHVGVSWQTQGE